MSISIQLNPLKGGEFLIRETKAEDVFIPEHWTDEQLMIAQTCQGFIEQNVIPVISRIDAQEDGLMTRLLDEAGKLGLCAISIPEQYGGFGKDFNTSMLVSEKTGAGASFSVAFSAHTGIATLPILYYGNKEQKDKYIPKLASAEWKGAYCLTEPSAGSDANSGKTRAVLSDDGKHYILNGQKMWITNAGIADVFTVFAKIGDDKDLSAFIVEKGTEGFTLNVEEHKMGIKGSSTRQVFFNDCKIPAGNLLSDRGKGFKIALNILNIGRIKLGAAVLGAAKNVITQSVKFANERQQFGKPIAKYGAIEYKLAEQAIRTYATESAVYRTGQNIEDAIQNLIENGMDAAEAKLSGTEQFAIEAAIIKVHGSETLDYVVDEGVQIYGGMGYSTEAPMERAYRDSRINRIFEGTNEINRLLIVDMMLKRALKGELDLMGPAKKVASELLSIPDFNGTGEDIFTKEKKYVANFKKAVLLVAGAAVQKLNKNLSEEQEILMYLADMTIEVYISESLQLRVEKLSQKNTDTVAEQVEIMKVYINDAADRIYKAGKEALNSFAEGDEKKLMLMGLKRFTKADDLNATACRRKIAAKIIEENSYCF
ncbi:acyl-CoA dehydrogenase family protein [Pedobacter sp. P351]|uniref:acyl-CoA dehydrogenase family protein n=1 Tax=Pedobacter superstes TaxID=3133441 RepID=UPI00309A334D